MVPGQGRSVPEDDRLAAPERDAVRRGAGRPRGEVGAQVEGESEGAAPRVDPEAFCLFLGTSVDPEGDGVLTARSSAAESGDE